jgi:SSS family solute:Na+ symporter
MALLFLMNVIIMLVIGKFWPKTDPYQLEYTNQVEITPYKYVNQLGIVIVVIVVAIYIYFAQ